MNQILFRISALFTSRRLVAVGDVDQRSAMIVQGAKHVDSSCFDAGIAISEVWAWEGARQGGLSEDTLLKATNELPMAEKL